MFEVPPNEHGAIYLCDLFNTLELSQHHPKSLINTHHSESFIPWGTECTPQGYQFNAENNDKPLAVGIQTFGQNYLSIRKPTLPNIWQSRYLTHPRLGNQPLTLHGSADLANVSPILKGTPASINWGFVLGFVYRFRGIRHSIQWSKISKVLSPPAYHAPQVTTLPSCWGQGVLSIIYFALMVTSGNMNTDSQIETKTETYWDHFGISQRTSLPSMNQTWLAGKSSIYRWGSLLDHQN